MHEEQSRGVDMKPTVPLPPPQHLKARTQLFAMGDHPTGVWQVETGYVSLCAFTREGRSCLVRLVCAGGLFGYGSLIRGQPYLLSAESLSDCLIRHIPARVVRLLKTADPEFSMMLEASLAAAHEATQQRVIDMMTSTAEVRFLSFCETIGRSQGRSTTGQFSIEIPFPFRKIADVVGISPEAMSRLIRKLKDDGIVVYQSKTALRLSPEWQAYMDAARIQPPTGTSIGYPPRRHGRDLSSPRSAGRPDHPATHPGRTLDPGALAGSAGQGPERCRNPGPEATEVKAPAQREVRSGRRVASQKIQPDAGGMPR